MPIIQGIAYPLALEDGGLKIASDADLIRCHIYAVLETYKQERILTPGFGLPQLVFTSVQNASVITERVRSVLKRYVPDANFSLKVSILEDGVLTIRVDWKLNEITQPAIQYSLS